jgi:hypothetical protein
MSTTFFSNYLKRPQNNIAAFNLFFYESATNSYSHPKVAQAESPRNYLNAIRMY